MNKSSRKEKSIDKTIYDYLNEIIINKISINSYEEDIKKIKLR